MTNGVFKLLRFSVVGFGLAGVAAAAPSCTNVTLLNQTVSNGDEFDNLQKFGGGTSTSCTFGSLTFSNFSLYVNTGYSTPTNLTVTLSFAGAGTLSFGTNMSYANGQDIDLQYLVTPGIAGMILTASSGGGGVNEGACSTQQDFNNLTGTPGVLGTCAGVNLGQGSAASGGSVTIPFSGSTQVDWIYKDISGVSGFSQTVVPEPVTFSLMGAGLLGIGFLGRRLRRKK